MAPAVSAYGHLPPSSWLDPTVTSQPGITLAARTGAMQHSLCNHHPRKAVLLYHVHAQMLPPQNLNYISLSGLDAEFYENGSKF